MVWQQLWKNPVTNELHFQVHPCGVQELFIDPLPEGAKWEGALYPDGAHITDLATVRGILYKMQRPAIAPQVSSVRDLHAASGLIAIVDTSSYTHMTGTRRTSCCSTTAASCIASLARSSPIKYARSTSATWPHLTTLRDRLPQMSRSGREYSYLTNAV